MTDLTSYFGNCAIEDAILEKCNKDVKYVACINVYEPIIRLFENGGDFVYRERGMSFASSGLIPLENWFNKFKNI